MYKTDWKFNEYMAFSLFIQMEKPTLHIFWRKRIEFYVFDTASITRREKF